MHSIDHIGKHYIPVSVRDEICSFIPLHLLRNPNQYRRRMYFKPEAYEFYMIKPTPTFAPTVWLDRILSRDDSENGVKLHALAKFEAKYGSLDDMDPAIGKVPTRTSLLRRVMAHFELSNHTVCNSTFHKLLVDPFAILDTVELEYIEQHFQSHWIACIDMHLFDENSTLESVERSGYAILVFAMLWALLQNPYLHFEVKSEVARYFTLCAATDDRFVFSVGLIGRCKGEFCDMLRYLANYPSDDAEERKVMLEFATQLRPLVMV